MSTDNGLVDENELPATMLEPTSFDDSDEQLRALNSEALAYRRTIERLTADRNRLLAALTQANEDTRYWMCQWAGNRTEHDYRELLREVLTQIDEEPAAGHALGDMESYRKAAGLPYGCAYHRAVGASTCKCVPD